MDFIGKLGGRFFTDVFRPADRLLVDFIFNQEHTQSNVEALLKGWDIEVAGGGKALALAYVARENQTLNFGTYTGPRLSGMWTRTRFDNLRLMADFGKVVKALNAEGIRPLVIKGGAIRILTPERPRIMGDIDLVVPIDDYERACEIVRRLGYVGKDIQTEHSKDFVDARTGAGVVDVHRWVDFGFGYDHDAVMPGLFARARPVHVQGGEVLLPAPEDHIIILVTNFAKNVINKQSVQGLLNAFFDIDIILSRASDFSWPRVLEEVRQIGTETFYYMGVALILLLAPKLLPEVAAGDLQSLPFVQYQAMLIYFQRNYRWRYMHIFRRVTWRRVLFGRQTVKLWLSIVSYYFFIRVADGHLPLVYCWFKYFDRGGLRHAR